MGNSVSQRMVLARLNLLGGANVSLRFGSTQEEFDRIPHSLGEFVRSGKIHGPLTHDGIEKSFHKFGEVNDRKIAGDLPILLSFRDDLTEQADGCGFRPSQFWRTNRVHRAGKNYSLPERSPPLRSHFPKFRKIGASVAPWWP